MLRNVTVEVEQGDPDVYEVTQTVALPELKCGETGHSYVVLALAEGGTAEPSVFSCELKFQVRCSCCCGGFVVDRGDRFVVAAATPVCICRCGGC